jgi:hypothetical protein
LYEGVGLSFGTAGKIDCPPFMNTYTSKDEVCFSVDSCWICYEQEPLQYCSSVLLSAPGLYMGSDGLSPQELATDSCKSLPSELLWLHEEMFINFLASNSERSLVLLLGSGSNGSITRQKLEGAATRHERYVPNTGLSGAVWHGDRAFASENQAPGAKARQPGKLAPVSDSGEAMRSLANSREALAALEKAVLDLEQKFLDAELEKARAVEWMEQLILEARSIETAVDAIDPENFGFVCKPVSGLKGDIIRGVQQLLRYVGILIEQFGLTDSMNLKDVPSEMLTQGPSEP